MYAAQAEAKELSYPYRLLSPPKVGGREGDDLMR